MPAPGVCLNIMETRQKLHGEGSITNPEKFFNQDYKQLREFCIIKGVRYLDDMFPPDSKSIGPGIPSLDLARVEWLRPAKIVSNPCLVVDGISRFDFGQGIIGNCWFLASIGALTFQKHILEHVVPMEQTFDDENYCGLFHFRFWRFGKWVDVVIDDKLPTINGRLIFVNSKDRNEFWPALLEKAYAKVCGSYTDMVSGTPAEAMRDFTGGVHMCIELSKPPSELWELLCRAGASSTLMSCGTQNENASDNSVMPNGLVQGHSYTVTGFRQVMSQGKPVSLVRLWNPWGKGEWNGDWSDRSSLWQTVSSEERKRCNSVDDDGEFWMTLEDLCKFYTDVDICGLHPDFLDVASSSHWKMCTYEGRWVAGTTAGGSLNNRDSFWTNPQFRIKITSNSSVTNTKNILVTLMQKPDKRNRRLVKNLHIGFSIFKLTEQNKDQNGKFPASFFKFQAPVAQTKTYMNAREVMELLFLKPGDYLIIPSTFNPNETASFILTIHSRTETHCYENSGDHKHERVEKVKQIKNKQEDENKKIFFRQYSDKYEEVDAEQLLKLLNDNILKGDLKAGGFSLDACRSMVALMDTSITGKLDSEEFVRLWNKIVKYKDIFSLTDVSKTGMLSLSELRNAFIASEIDVSDGMLNLMAVRYGVSTGHMTLESFISLIIRLDCMKKIFKQLSDGKAMKVQENEWLYLSMYT